MSRNSARDRAICLEAHLKRDAMGEHMVCHCCGVRFDPRTRRWRADHIRRHAHDGPSSAENLWPILEACDTGPDGKAAADTSAVAKGKRMRAKAYGVARKAGFRKPPPGYNPWTRRVE